MRKLKDVRDDIVMQGLSDETSDPRTITKLMKNSTLDCGSMNSVQVNMPRLYINIHESGMKLILKEETV